VDCAANWSVVSMSEDISCLCAHTEAAPSGVYFVKTGQEQFWTFAIHLSMVNFSVE
jgi:hypothetical protein